MTDYWEHIPPKVNGYHAAFAPVPKPPKQEWPRFHPCILCHGELHLTRDRKSVVCTGCGTIFPAAMEEAA